MTNRSTDKTVVFETVDGVLLLDKPVGPSSNGALQRARRLCRARKAGHAGALDPMAGGLLPICFGEATKFSSFSLDADKTYRSRLRLGVTTTTGDAEGEILKRRETSGVTESLLQAVAAGFVGDIDQVPPMYSALKRDGKALYEYARAGETVERASRRVTIYRLEITAIDWPDVEMAVACSKGTYIRTLAEDIGEKLGCGAHLIALRREGIGPWTVEEAITLDALAAMDEPRETLGPVDGLLSHLPICDLSLSEARTLYFGRNLNDRADLTPGLYRLYAAFPEPRFVGLGHCREDGVLRSSRLLSALPE